jgi:hypothetical protein
LDTLLPLTLCLLTIASGCSDEVGTRYPVSGAILLNGQPLRGKTGSVLFKPDPARGNTSSYEAVGTLDAEGSYTLMTRGRKGAPSGWYKVLITASEQGARAERYVRNPPSPIPPRYSREETTPLGMEVVAEAGPGAYDLNLTTK